MKNKGILAIIKERKNYSSFWYFSVPELALLLKTTEFYIEQHKNLLFDELNQYEELAGDLRLMIAGKL
jgi:hypothetical protein